MYNIAINGFGRIGRLVLRIILEKKNMKVVAINDLSDTETLAHLLKNDSVHGKLNKDVEVKDDKLIIDGNEIAILKEKDPKQLPWKDLKVDVAIEATGIFRSRKTAEQHITAGAKKVLISAPAKDEIDATIVFGVNDEILKDSDKIVSNASCTTNCFAPIMKAIDEEYGVESCFMTTIHSYTRGQNILDAVHKDLRRARAAAVNMVPTTTGAAIATQKVLPNLKGKIEAMAVRVPTPNGSLIDASIRLKKDTTKEEINGFFKKLSETKLKGVLGYSTAPLVSSDIIGNPNSSILDAPLTMVHGKTIKIVSWYDNEYGYSSRVVDLAEKMVSM